MRFIRIIPIKDQQSFKLLVMVNIQHFVLFIHQYLCSNKSYNDAHVVSGDTSLQCMIVVTCRYNCIDIGSSSSRNRDRDRIGPIIE